MSLAPKSPDLNLKYYILMAHFPRKAKGVGPPPPSFSVMQITVDKTVIPGNLVDALMTVN